MCGLIFERWARQSEFSSSAEKEAGGDEWMLQDHGPRMVQYAKELFFHIPTRYDPAAFFARAVVFLLFILWGGYFLAMPTASPQVFESFLHGVHLAFHEAGHLIFHPFGELIMFMGGGIAQSLMPLIVMGVMLIQSRDTFGASIALWWLGHSLLDTAPYIGDARVMELMLLGGGTGWETGGHDWNNALGMMGMLSYDRTFAALVWYAGVVAIVASWLWGGYLLWLMYRSRHGGAEMEEGFGFSDQD